MIKRALGEVALYGATALFVAWLLYGMILSQTARDDFLSKCIEFNNLTRCEELYILGRPDLIMKRVGNE